MNDRPAPSSLRSANPAPWGLGRGLAALAAADAISGIVLTDGVGDVLDQGTLDTKSRFTVLSVSPLLGSAVARMLGGIPLTPLL